MVQIFLLTFFSISLIITYINNKLNCIDFLDIYLGQTIIKTYGIVELKDLLIIKSYLNYYFSNPLNKTLFYNFTTYRQLNGTRFSYSHSLSHPYLVLND